MHKKSPKVSWGHEVVLNSGCDVGYTNQYVSKTHGTIHWKEETLYYMSALKRRKTKIKKNKKKEGRRKEKKLDWLGSFMGDIFASWLPHKNSFEVHVGHLGEGFLGEQTSMPPEGMLGAFRSLTAAVIPRQF